MNAIERALPAVALLTLAATSSAAQDADLVLTNGRIATLAFDDSRVEAIAIRDGVVHATGTDEQVRAFVGEDTLVLDLEGRTVVPGLNDSHLHAVRGGRFYNLELRWDGIDRLSRALDMVREQAARTPEGQWVRVIGAWSPHQFEEHRMPTIAELDEAAPDTPTFVLFLYSQAFLNRAGVEALGLDESSVPPEGGRYEFVDGGAILHAEPNPTILYKTIARLPELTPEQQLDSTRQFYRELNRFGLTSVIDAGGGGHLYPVDYVASKSLADAGELPLRISFFLFPQRPGKELEDFRGWTTTDEAGVDADITLSNGYTLQGGGEFLVWSAGDFENFMAPRPELGPPMDRHLRAVTTLLAQNGWPFRIHATYGESIDRILDVFEQVHAEYPLDELRWAIDHAETIRPDQIQRVQRLGGGIAIQNRMAYAGELFAGRYGAEAAAAAPPLRALLESGVPLGAGTDATRVSSHNPWLALHWMVSGKTVGDLVLTPPEQRLTRLEALRLYTTGSAWFSGEETVKGRLTPGQYADLAVLSADYFEVPADEIRDIESALTVVGGEIVHAAGPFAAHRPPLGEAIPEWSPVRHFGGYGAPRVRRSD